MSSVTFEPGLVSVSFRALAPKQIVDLARECGLRGIEWGGDVHVPPGDLPRARDVRQMTADAGLRTFAYGSYLRLGEDDAPAQFDAAIDVALELNAPAIRVWAGRRGSAQANAEYRRRVADHAIDLADRARARTPAPDPAHARARAANPDLMICYEYHADTLTDSDASALDLLAATDHPNIAALWQPPHEMTIEQREQSLRGVIDRLQHVHVFHWPRRGERAPLAEGAEGWKRYIRLLRSAFPRTTCPLLLEFVRDDDPAQLRADAATLREIVDDEVTR